MSRMVHTIYVTQFRLQGKWFKWLLVRREEKPSEV